MQLAEINPSSQSSKDEKQQQTSDELATILQIDSENEALNNNGVTSLQSQTTLSQTNASNQNSAFSQINIQSHASEVAEAQQTANALDNISSEINTEQLKLNKMNGQTLNETISIFRKDFAEAVKEKVMVMISQKLQQFDITLDPPELGNVHVRVNLQGEQAVDNFMVQNQQAKEAFEQNLDKLKQMLSEQGVDVGESNVEQQNQQTTANNDDNSKQKADGTLDNNSQGSSNLDKQTHGDTRVLSANLFDSSATRVDYYA